ncbi:hypothetical protein ES705_27545 [subsurface metagenome]
MLEPLTAGLIFVVAGAAGAATYGAYDFVKRVGPQLEPGDLLPMPPPYPPVPRFMYEKPELLQSLRR